MSANVAKNLPSGTILYVEDEEGDRFFMEYAFRGAGLGTALRMVPDGRIALSYLSGSRLYSDRILYPVPDLVLLDLNLPEVPGFEVLGWIRNHPQYSRLPVVIFSASNYPDDISRAKLLGANDFWQKPPNAFHFSQIVARLQREWPESLRGSSAPRPRESSNLHHGE